MQKTKSKFGDADQKKQGEICCKQNQHFQASAMGMDGECCVFAVFVLMYEPIWITGNKLEREREGGIYIDWLD